METATFGMGCFWGPEVTFGQIDGVIETTVGYMGGTVDDPDYRTVCTGRTGHVEVVQITFDPAKITYQQLLDTFYQSHDPTQLDRQGPDVGTQYRSVIFVHDENQRERAETTRKTLDESGALPRPVATSIESVKAFWRAEDYHQKYLEKRGLAVCHV